MKVIYKTMKEQGYKFFRTKMRKIRTKLALYDDIIVVSKIR